MDHHINQPSSHVQTHSDETQLAVLTQQNKRLTRKILPFEVKHYQNQDELNTLKDTKQLKYHSFAIEQQPPFFTRKGITGFTNRLSCILN